MYKNFIYSNSVTNVAEYYIGVISAMILKAFALILILKYLRSVAKRTEGSNKS